MTLLQERDGEVCSESSRPVTLSSYCSLAESDNRRFRASISARDHFPPTRFGVNQIRRLPDGLSWSSKQLWIDSGGTEKDGRSERRSNAKKKLLRLGVASEDKFRSSFEVAPHDAPNSRHWTFLRLREQQKQRQRRRQPRSPRLRPDGDFIYFPLALGLPASLWFSSIELRRAARVAIKADTDTGDRVFCIRYVAKPNRARTPNQSRSFRFLSLSRIFLPASP